MPNIEIAFAQSRRLDQHEGHRNRVQEGVSRDRSRTQIPALAEGIGNLALQSLAEALLQLTLEGVVGRRSVKQHRTDAGAAAPVRINTRPRLLVGTSASRGDGCGRVTGKDQAYPGNRRGLDQIDLVRCCREMNRARPDVADRHGEVLRKLPLDVEIPVENIGTLGLSVDKAVANVEGIKVDVRVDAC